MRSSSTKMNESTQEEVETKVKVERMASSKGEIITYTLVTITLEKTNHVVVLLVVLGADLGAVDAHAGHDVTSFGGMFGWIELVGN